MNAIPTPNPETDGSPDTAWWARPAKAIWCWDLVDQKPGRSKAAAITLVENHTLSPLPTCLLSRDRETGIRAETERKRQTQKEKGDSDGGNKSSFKCFPASVLLQSKFRSPIQVALTTHSLLDIFMRRKTTRILFIILLKKKKETHNYFGAVQGDESTPDHLLSTLN